MRRRIEDVGRKEMWKDPVRGCCSDPLERWYGPGSGDTSRDRKKVTISELFGMYGDMYGRT